MKESRPRRIVSPPGLLGTLCAFALLVACFVFPDELFDIKTPYFFSGIIIAGCFLWAVLRTVFGKD